MHLFHGSNDGVAAGYKRTLMVLLPAVCILLFLITWVPTVRVIYLSGIPFGLPSMVKLGSYLFAVFATSTSAASFTPILPPSYPLAVRNPYLSGIVPYFSFLEDLVKASSPDSMHPVIGLAVDSSGTTRV